MSRAALFALGSLGLAMVGCGGALSLVEARPVDVTAVKPEGPAALREASPVQIDPRIVDACGDIPKPQFAFDSSSVSDDARATLTAITRCFTEGALKGRSIKLVGHADPRGETMYNLALGQRRAATVATFLKGKGLPDKQILTSSRGEFDAVGADESSWAQDRRVDLVLDGDAPASTKSATRTASGEWVAARDGRTPDGALVGGEEKGKQFVVCRAVHGGGKQPGRVAEKACAINVDGAEVMKPEYQVLVVHGPTEWVAAHDGAVPARAVKVGTESGRDLYLCRAKHEGGSYPGKVVEKHCSISRAGQVASKAEYDVLTFP